MYWFGSLKKAYEKRKYIVWIFAWINILRWEKKYFVLFFFISECFVTITMQANSNVSRRREISSEFISICCKCVFSLNINARLPQVLHDSSLDRHSLARKLFSGLFEFLFLKCKLLTTDKRDWLNSKFTNICSFFIVLCTWSLEGNRDKKKHWVSESF